MIVVIDNYDSFVFNLVQYLGEMRPGITVLRNDAATVEEIEALAPERIVISPGPGRPDDAGISIALIRALSPRVPILGVCLGHQAIARCFGAEVGPARSLLHGKTSAIRHDGTGVLRGLPDPFTATRYHSLAVIEDTLPGELAVTARTEDGEIMALRHRERPVEGVQFHPESILTAEGKRIVANFLEEDAP